MRRSPLARLVPCRRRGCWPHRRIGWP